ncbi:MAG: hypothetical protein NZM00_12250 [Anaerolinea sp.]|nr:hypothetical protein [Anaerolinea sp.]
MVKHEIKSISIGSAFKIGLVVNALLAAVLGGGALLLQAFVLSLLASGTSSFTINGRQTELNLTGLTLGVLCLAWIIGIGVSAIIGGIGAAAAALFYNLAARFVGGIEYTAAIYQAETDPLAGRWDLTDRSTF